MRLIKQVAPGILINRIVYIKREQGQLFRPVKHMHKQGDHPYIGASLHASNNSDLIFMDQGANDRIQSLG